MDTIEIIISALLAGSNGRKVDRDSKLSRHFSDLQAYIQSTYPNIDLSPIEQGTISAGQKSDLTHQLRNTHVDQDPALLQRVMQLHQTLIAQPVDTADAIGVNLHNVQAELIKIQDVIVHISKPTEPPSPGEAPYKGLNYYDVKDSDLFFGREKLVTTLVDHLRDHSFLAVIGASGSGKSSLVRAGLVPALQRRQILIDGSFPPSGSETWPVIILTPTDRPLYNLADHLIQTLDLNVESKTLVAEMKNNPYMLSSFGQKFFDPHTKAQDRQQFNRLVLIVDQFEELFTQLRSDNHQNRSENQQIRRAYIDNLLNAAQNSNPDHLAQESQIIVVITLRADFYVHCAAFENLREALACQQKYIGSMNRDELRRAIDEPLQQNGWTIQPELVDQLLYDVGDEPGALPLLSHALLETWKRRSGRTLTFAGYLASGRVQGAIAKTAENVYSRELASQHQVLARNIFLRLTELGEGVEYTRRRVNLDELIPKATEPSEVQVVLDILAKARLITISSDENGKQKGAQIIDNITARKIHVELSHEALIREWPALHRWLEDNQAELSVYRYLTETTQQWIDRGRDPSVLLRGARLAEAIELVKERTNDLTEAEYEFLTASKRLMWRNWGMFFTAIILITVLITLGVTGQLNRWIFRPLEAEKINIPSGEFWMGTSDQDVEIIKQVDPDFRRPSGNRELFHPVFLDDYKIDKYEVTNQRYYQCVRANQCAPPSNNRYSSSEYAQYPVTHVNWSQADQFCKWNDGRLPTEAEWERAAKGGIYPWGNQPDDTKANVKPDEGQIGEIRPVGSYEDPDDEDLDRKAADMAGNVWEWVADWFDREYYKNSPYQNPKGPEVEPETGHRTVRGGSFKDDWSLARTAHRAGFAPYTSEEDLGFRCAYPAFSETD